MASRMVLCPAHSDRDRLRGRSGGRPSLRGPSAGRKAHSEEAHWLVTVVAFASIVAVLGGIAGGVLRAGGWAMFIGGLIQGDCTISHAPTALFRDSFRPSRR